MGLRADLTLLAITKVVAGASVWLGGFRAVSDDDYARVVLAQSFAELPRLDPTGSSWLPFPFWVTGGVAMVFGPSLDVARVAAIVQGILAVWLVYWAGRLCFTERREALAGAVLAATLPWSARLGVATVPELPTAALCVFALITMVPRARSRRMLGAIALLVATLSRYEAWPIAACFCLWSVYEARQHPQHLRGLIGSALVAVLGPAAWLGHNAVAHGDAFAFAVRVSAYREAVVGASGRTLIAYPEALVREAPLLCGLVVIVALARWRRGERDVGPFRIVLWSAAALLVTLILMSLRGGGPTHHPERAVLVLWLLGAMYVGAGIYRLGRRAPAARHGGLPIVGLIAVMFCLRASFRGHFEPAVRASERALGAAVAGHVPPNQRVLIEAVDYGYFAVFAASGRPNGFVIDRSVDPRRPKQPSAFVSASALKARARIAGARFVAGRVSAATNGLGKSVYDDGRLGLWRLDSAKPGRP
ncbi:MAG: glycosyltransferase family 39 protein [Polyangiaceae bacterium]